MLNKLDLQTNGLCKIKTVCQPVFKTFHLVAQKISFFIYSIVILLAKEQIKLTQPNFGLPGLT